MLRKNLAGKLVAAKNEKARIVLLSGNPKIADEGLARALKEICYAAWTTEPTKALRTARAAKSLLKFNQTDEIRAYYLWLSGISDLTLGKPEPTIVNLDNSAELFLKIGKEHESANTQVAKLYALALLGKYDEAVRCGGKALKIFEKYGDQLAAGKTEKNLGNIVARREDNHLAEKFYLSARKRFQKLGNIEELTMSENSLANTYAELNDFRQAEKFYSRALESAREAKMFVTVAEIEASMGNLATFRGKLDQALRYLELSRQKYESLRMPHQTAIAELEIADIYLELNLAREALVIYQRVADQLKQMKLQGDEARARANLGRSSVIMGEMKTAREELKRSARLYLDQKNSAGAAAVILIEAKLELTLQNYRRVLKLVGKAEKLLENSSNLRRKLELEWVKAEALGNSGEISDAERLLKQIFTAAKKQEQRNLAQIALNSLGNLANRSGDSMLAKKHFKNAVEMIEKLRAPLPAEEFRMAFLADKLAPFENLAKILIGERNWKEAFFYIEEARARSLAENIDVGDRSIEKSKGPAKLSKKLETLREELNWFYSRLDRAEESEIENLLTEAKRREIQIADAMRQIESTREAFLTPRNAVDRKSSTVVKNLQIELGTQRILVEFVSFDGVISAFVISGKKVEYIENLVAESKVIELLEGLQFQFGALRFGRENLGKFMPQLKNRADSYLNKLYAALLKPLENYFGLRDLVIVPVGALHYVPFHALHNGVNYLIESREVIYSPSAAVWQKLRSKPVKKITNALLFGYADERIPLVDGEIKSLEKIFDQSKSFTKKNATFAAYVANAPNFDVLHIACHGQFRPENPLFSSLNLADGYVTVRDICAQKLRARLVTLSACETGLNKIFAGDEILGLARAFLVAGADSLILTLWTVNDSAAAVLMKDLYAQIIGGKSASGALRIAQCNLIERGFHPYYWSPFAIIGK